MPSAKETSSQWLEEGAAVRARMLAGGGKPGLASAGGLAGKTGIEIMRAMLSGELPYPYIAETLDFALIAVAPGSATFQGTPQLKHFNPLGTVHGGWYATLLDSAVGCAVHTMMPAGRGFTTVTSITLCCRCARVSATSRNETTSPAAPLIRSVSRPAVSDGIATAVMSAIRHTTTSISISVTPRSG